MIKEDYVSYEVAKLLKEKGFNEDCKAYYEDGKFCWVWNDGCSRNTDNPKFVSCPSQALAMKWLREVCSIIIMIDYNEDEDCEDNERYGFTTYCKNERKVVLATYPTYEDAVEAGLKYCLTELI